ncbi:MAG: hypothetical protein M3N50_03250 [Pseudomonadota bacterium]|nr:hypothetical protein [Pseudomonadota bacterium]
MKKDTVHDELFQRLVNGSYRMGEKILVKQHAREIARHRSAIGRRVLQAVERPLSARQ